MRPDPFGSVDHAALEGGVDLAAWSKHRGGSRPGDDLAAEVRNAHLEALVVADCVDLLPEPSRHLRGVRKSGAWHEAEGGVRLLAELEPVTLVEPRGHALRVHAERDRGEPLESGLLVVPVLPRSHERTDLALRTGIE